MADRPTRGLLDTSVVIDLQLIDAASLPQEVTISVVTLAELSAGPAAARDAEEKGRRQDRLQRTEAAFDPVPFDVEAARAYGRVYAAVAARGRQRRRRLADLQLAATALSQGLPLVTRNAADFRGLEGLITIIEV